MVSIPARMGNATAFCASLAASLFLSSFAIRYCYCFAALPFAVHTRCESIPAQRYEGVRCGVSGGAKRIFDCTLDAYLRSPSL
ncbi:hypothetical protein DFH29DRAFT_897134 [Suillus ampliporus]|nr:hypothetical protein DFH29DRAFT_897134 [Suillus ampliporus]